MALLKSVESKAFCLLSFTMEANNDSSVRKRKCTSKFSKVQNVISLTPSKTAIFARARICKNFISNGIFAIFQSSIFIIFLDASLNLLLTNQIQTYSRKNFCGFRNLYHIWVAINKSFVMSENYWSWNSCLDKASYTHYKSSSSSYKQFRQPVKTLTTKEKQALLRTKNSLDLVWYNSIQKDFMIARALVTDHAVQRETARRQHGGERAMEFLLKINFKFRALLATSENDSTY